MKFIASILPLLPWALLTGKTLAVGCAQHTFGVCQDNIVHWYDPDDGQICDPHDCGGGRAPPRKDVPGCAFYTGTETLRTEASYMPCFTSGKLVLTTEKPTPTDTSSGLPLVTTFTTSTSAAITDGPSITDAPSEGAEEESTSITTATGNAGSIVEAGGSLIAAVAGVVLGAVALV
ncbi:hypothetical protein QBC36DRAFT_338324 [Triangularia setosa]|uniref:Uncharacterized protein n=1 Tax=Triangularia setosa TaxID=2587417 RepID=A0AAN7A321_9PEZI|nr:hypothetical protein QBC36DRAFT_338324 [Podospora setosa]